MKTDRFLLFLTVAFLFHLTGCKKEYENFIFSYSMESITNYKVMITFKSDQTFLLEEYSYFFDNAAKKQRPILVSGTLSDSEFSKVKSLIHKSAIFNMSDSYGFDHPNPGNILYQVYLKSGNKEKFISLRDMNPSQLSSDYRRLIKHINDLISSIKINQRKTS